MWSKNCIIRYSVLNRFKQFSYFSKRLNNFFMKKTWLEPQLFIFYTISKNFVLGNFLIDSTRYYHKGIPLIDTFSFSYYFYIFPTDTGRTIFSKNSKYNFRILTFFGILNLPLNCCLSQNSDIFPENPVCFSEFWRFLRILTFSQIANFVLRIRDFISECRLFAQYSDVFPEFRI